MEYVLIVLFLAVAVGFLAYTMKKKEKDDKNQDGIPTADAGTVSGSPNVVIMDGENPDQETGDFEDLNEKFIQHSNGQKILDLVRTYNADDQIIIRSMLDSSGICSYINFSNLNSLFPGVPIPGYTDSIISVFEDDKDEAKKIILEYIEAVKNKDQEKLGTTVRNVVEFAVGGYAIRSGSNKLLPELLV